MNLPQCATTLDELFDILDFQDAIDAGYVREQSHPDDPDLCIANYSQTAAYERVWTPVTLQCRGLIYRVSTMEVLARPFPKFFNHDEPEAEKLDLSAEAVVLDKLDGSLGIVYTAPDGLPAVATRGSFASDQAVHATKVLRSKYAAWRPPAGVTVLTEIIYPGNRIVCDYGSMDDLVVLGSVSIANGLSNGPDGVVWPGDKAEVFPYTSLLDALAAPPRDGAEGYVIWFPSSDTRVKIKQADYVALHKIVTGLNARIVWEQIGAGKTVQEICEPLPDEFHAWVDDVANGLNSTILTLIADTYAEHTRIVTSLPEGWTRKDYAMIAGKSPLRSWLFLHLDGKDLARSIWPTLRPSGDQRPRDLSGVDA